MDPYGLHRAPDCPDHEAQQRIITASPSLSPPAHHSEHLSSQPSSHHYHHPHHTSSFPDDNASSFSVMSYRNSEEPGPNSICGGPVSTATVGAQSWTSLAPSQSPNHVGSPQRSVTVYTPPESMNSATSPGITSDFGATPSFPGMFTNSMMPDHTSLQPLTGLQSPTSFVSHSPGPGLVHSPPQQHQYPLPPTADASTTSSPYNIKHEAPLPQPSVSSTETETNDAESQKSPSQSRSCPDLPYAQWIYKALLSKPDRTMSLKEIYDWISTHTNKGSTAGRGWQNSIRHNLSMNAAFRKQDAKESSNMGLNGIGSPPKRSTNWVLEDWALESGVQSTTRYRKTHPSRKQQAHRNQQAGGNINSSNSNYIISSTLDSPYGSGLDRAAAGRRGGYATRQSRARRQGAQNQLQAQQVAAQHQSQPQHGSSSMHGMHSENAWLDDRSSAWAATPRAFNNANDGMMSGLVDHMRIPTHAHPSYHSHIPLSHHTSPATPNGLFNTSPAFNTSQTYGLITSHPTQLRSGFRQQQQQHSTYRPQQQLPSLSFDNTSSNVSSTPQQQQQNHQPQHHGFAPMGGDEMGAWGTTSETPANADASDSKFKQAKALNGFYPTS